MSPVNLNRPTQSGPTTLALKQAIIAAMSQATWDIHLTFVPDSAGTPNAGAMPDPLPFVSPDGFLVLPSADDGSFGLKIQRADWIEAVPGLLRLSITPPVFGDNPNSLKDAESLLIVALELDGIDPDRNTATVILPALIAPDPTPKSSTSVPATEINYLQRDYTAIRTGMLDRIKQMIPNWQASSSADIGIMSVEVLAYAADYLSYTQDAVATEAYLSTARRRLSMQRHARLLGYFPTQSANARTWVGVQVATRLTLPKHTGFVSSYPNTLVVAQSNMRRDDKNHPDARIFETLQSAALFPNHNILHFTDFGRPNFMLQKGATKAILQDGFVESPDRNSIPQRNLRALKIGDVLAVEQRKLPSLDTSTPKAHMIRITRMRTLMNAGQPILEIGWSKQDALPFDLVVCQSVDGVKTPDLAVMMGNQILCDLGGSEYLELPNVTAQTPYEPLIPSNDLIFSVPYDPIAERELPACELVSSLGRTALANVQIIEDFTPNDVLTAPNFSPNIPTNPNRTLPKMGRPPVQANATNWSVTNDILTATPYTRAFMVEPANDDRHSLRFGDGTFGAAPTNHASMTAIYRRGNPHNLGGVSLASIIAPNKATFALFSRTILKVANAVPAQGYRPEQSLTSIRNHAPNYYRLPQSCATLSDYKTIAERQPDVAQAAIKFKWSGSWPTAQVAVLRELGPTKDPAFLGAVTKSMSLHQIMDRDIEVIAAKKIPLRIVLSFAIASGHFEAEVKDTLIKTFGNGTYGSGEIGYFNLTQWQLGQAVYASDILSRALAVTGVENAALLSFARAQNEFGSWTSTTKANPATKVALDFCEIPDVTSDPRSHAPGKIEFIASSTVSTSKQVANV